MNEKWQPYVRAAEKSARKEHEREADAAYAELINRWGPRTSCIQCTHSLKAPGFINP
jgi:hypothetical protein